MKRINIQEISRLIDQEKLEEAINSIMDCPYTNTEEIDVDDYLYKTPVGHFDGKAEDIKGEYSWFNDTCINMAVDFLPKYFFLFIDTKTGDILIEYDKQTHDEDEAYRRNNTLYTSKYGETYTYEEIVDQLREYYNALTMREVTDITDMNWCSEDDFVEFNIKLIEQGKHNVYRIKE